MKNGMSTETKLMVSLYGLGVALFLYFNLLLTFGDQQFALLAKSFLKGHLYLGSFSVTGDASYYRGLAYWPQGVFPAIVMVPFVSLFQSSIHQGHVQFLLNLLNIFLLYKIAFKITRNQKTSVWLTFAYIFATAYMVVGLFPWSWWYAQIVASSALLLLLYEYFYKRRWWVMGIYIACAMATRIDLTLAVLFPLLMILVSREKLKQKISSVLLLFSPLFFGLALIFLYNFLRFGSVWEFGYSYHIPALVSARKILATYGTWSLFYIPTNLYYLFFSGLDGVFVQGTRYLTFPFVKPDAWGMSIFLTSPILLWCLKTRWKEQVVKIAAWTALAILVFIIGYFGVGARQYGYRYALDFQPFLFVLLCFAFQKRMSWKVKALITASFFINIFLFPSIFTTIVE
jgi:hypothetical protein